MTKFSALALLLCAPLAAQSSLFSIPDNNAAAGTCNVIPLGSTSSTSSFANVRYQTLIFASELNNAPTMLCGLRFAACGTGARTFDSLTIRMGHTTATSLTQTFDTNLPPGTGTTVLDVQNYTWHNITDVWNDIGLQQAFVYNGTDNVVIEIIAMNAVFTGSGSAGFHRESTHQRVYATNYNGTQTTGSSGNAALKMQLHFADATTWTFGEGCAGSNGTPTLSFTGEPVLGQTFSVDLMNAPASSPVALNFGLFNNPPMWPLDLGPFGAANCFLYHDTIVSLSLPSDPNGVASLPIGVPANGPICGILFAQWICLDPGANALGATTSNFGRAQVGF